MYVEETGSRIPVRDTFLARSLGEAKQKVPILLVREGDHRTFAGPWGSYSPAR